ncbi:aldehyde reductase II [Fusarium heterosporum]|uniref:Aldehyde reductase II n=1 Tax=Fusarium heterosporum TaxID=42747 RepID=A0A8H5U156_FUSHE|nr:aldehyde reductase II [Fusarium heterosporum]
MHIENPAIPLGSVVVVIGANGYMGVETCEKLLQAGFHVRGTVRDVEQHRSWMHNLFDEKWPDSFELIAVPDFEAEGAFNEAFQGAKGVIYASTPIIFDPNPDKVINPVIKGTINTLEASARAGVERYVLSSSSKAVESTVYDRPHHITSNMFNYEAIRKTCCEPTVKGFDRCLTVYSAGRTLAELAFWSWVGENQPPFVANCIVPDGQFGRALDPQHTTSSFGMLKSAIKGDWDGVVGQVAYYTDVQDTARLLVAAVALPSVANERIFAYCHNSTWNGLRNKIKDIFPDRENLVTGHDHTLGGKDLSDAGPVIQRAEEILRQIGQPGFASEDDILRDFVSCR